MFNRKKIYDEKVFLKIGTVYFKPLLNKAIEKATINSTIYSSLLNNALFFHIIEKEIVVLSRKQWKKLSVQDGEKIREKTKKILESHGILSTPQESEKTKEGLNQEDINWFEKTASEGITEAKRALTPNIEE